MASIGEIPKGSPVLVTERYGRLNRSLEVQELPEPFLWVDMVDDDGVSTGYEATDDDIARVHEVTEGIDLGELAENTYGMVDSLRFQGAEEIVDEEYEQANIVRKKFRAASSAVLSFVLAPLAGTSLGGYNPERRQWQRANDLFEVTDSPRNY